MNRKYIVDTRVLQSTKLMVLSLEESFVISYIFRPDQVIEYSSMYTLRKKTNTPLWHEFTAEWKKLVKP